MLVLPLFNFIDFLIMLFILKLNDLGFLSGSPKITFVLGCATAPVVEVRNGDSLLNPNLRSFLIVFGGILSSENGFVALYKTSWKTIKQQAYLHQEL